MGAAYWLVGAESEGSDGSYDSYSITYNLGPMLRAAKFPDWKVLDGVPARDAEGLIADAAGRIRADLDYFRTFNSPNGWGTVEGALRFLDEFAAACAERPDATINSWL